MPEPTREGAPPRRKTWNFTPALPLQLAPYWDWPLRPIESLFCLLRSWNPLAMRFVYLAVAVAVWAWFSPDITRAATLAPDWVFQVWLRNFIILTVVAGGLHLLLWRFRLQEDEYRYDMRPMGKGVRAFWFKNQVFDNMLWSGDVLAPSDEEARAIDSLNRLVAADDRVENVLLTVRDGVQLIVKR